MNYSEDINWSILSYFGKIENCPGLLLWKISARWRRKLEQNLKAFNITHVQFYVLLNIALMTKASEKITQIDISRKAEIDIATISQILRHLDKKKIIKRQHLKNDERSKYISLTKLGTKIINDTMPVVQKMDKAFFNVIANENPNPICKLKDLLNSE